MKIIEAIEGPLYMMVRRAVDQKLKEWLVVTVEQIEQGVRHLAANHKEVIDRYFQNKNKHDDNEYEHYTKARDNYYQMIYDLINEAGHHKDDLYDHIVSTFRFALETALRQIAQKYIERKFGKIEKAAPDTKYQELIKKNLYYLQYILVDIDTNATHKSGKPRTGGGYYQSFPHPKEFTDRYSHSGDVDWIMPGVGIKVFTTVERLWMAAETLLRQYFTERFYGEAEYDKDFDELMSDILPTFVHEVVHMEQNVRAHGQYHRGLSYTPQLKPRPKNYKHQRVGYRGHPSHLEDAENAGMEDWIEYFGTDHEIEAYAAGAAAEIVNYLVSELRKYNETIDASTINSGIDAYIVDISKYGGYQDFSSMKSYSNYIQDKASKLARLRKDERTLNKINIGARKVWVIFLKKLMKHLLSYKQPTTTTGSKYRLTYPRNYPQLPDRVLPQKERDDW